MYLLRKNVSPLDKVHWVITLVIRVTLLLAVIGGLVNRNWVVLFISVVTFFLTFLPRIIEKNYRVDLPPEFEIVIVLFIYATLFLGEVHDYYTRFWWWDVILHTGSALAFGIVGFLIAYMLYRGRRFAASALLLALFSFSFAVSIGVLWEIFEFAMDAFFGMNMQKSGLVDTMWDLIVDCIGAFIASIAGYFYVKRGPRLLFDRAIEEFIEENPKLFE